MLKIELCTRQFFPRILSNDSLDVRSYSYHINVLLHGVGSCQTTVEIPQNLVSNGKHHRPSWNVDSAQAHCFTQGGKTGALLWRASAVLSR